MTADPAPVADKASPRIRLAGLLAAIGFILFGAMFVSFGITDGDIMEDVGGVGLVLVGIGVLLGTWDTNRL